MSPGRLAAVLALGAVLVLPPPAARAAGPFSDWAAIFLAGDYHAHSGAPSEVFDNARRDAAAAFVRAGFSAANARQLSVRPERYPAERPMRANLGQFRAALQAVAAKAKGGCLVYMTSHGEPAGFLIDDKILRPQLLARMLDETCGARPTVVVVSACFSGVFAPALSGPNRMVMTAARPDRTSFGCTEDDRYPYFDACVIESLPKAAHFGELAIRARSCVDAREKAERLTPPSEPQIRIGAALGPMLPLYVFEPAS